MGEWNLYILSVWKGPAASFPFFAMSVFKPEFLVLRFFITEQHLVSHDHPNTTGQKSEGQIATETMAGIHSSLIYGQT